MARTLRRFVPSLLGALLATAGAALAEDAKPAWPSRPVSIVVPYVPGGPSDLLARALAGPLQAAIGQSVVVENRSGANGIVAAQHVVRQPPDGHTLFVAASGLMTVTPAVNARTPYDSVRDLTHLTVAISAPNLLVMNPAVPANTVAELVSWLKANPAGASNGSSGIGSSEQLGMELFKLRTGTEPAHVPYPGGGAAVADLVSGTLHLALLNIATVSSHVAGGRLRAIAVGGGERHALLPSVPTVAESGVDGFASGSWHGIVAPRGMAPELRARVQEALRAALRNPEIGARLAATGFTVAVDNARRIGERDNCVVMMGGGRTPNAIALREPLAEMGLPWMGAISAGTTVIEHQNGRNEWMFRISMKDRWAAGFLIDQAKQRSPSGRIGIVYEGTGWGQGAVPDLEAAARRANVAVAGKETWNIGDQDMSAQMIRLRDAGVDTIVLWAVDRESANMLRSMDRIGYKPRIVSAWGLTTAFAPAVGPLAEGVLVAGTFNWNGPLAPPAQAAYDAMRAKFPSTIRTTADMQLPSGMANGWDATFVIAEALKLAGSFDRTKLRDAFYRVSHEGIVANYAPAFVRGSQERMDAILPEAYKMQAFHNGVLMPVEATPYGVRN